MTAQKAYLESLLVMAGLGNILADLAEICERRAWDAKRKGDPFEFTNWDTQAIALQVTKSLIEMQQKKGS